MSIDGPRAPTDAQVEQFIQAGFVRIDQAFPKQVAAQARAILWRDLACDPDDPSSWTRPVVRLGWYGQEPFPAAANTPPCMPRSTGWSAGAGGSPGPNAIPPCRHPASWLSCLRKRFLKQRNKTAIKSEKPISHTGDRLGMERRPPRSAPQGLGRPVTLRDVARTAGVSVATASKALNDQGRMADETRERIRQAAKALGFRPNGLAQSLSRRRSFTVGLLTNDTYGRFTLPVMAGIADALVGNGVSVFLCNIEDDPRLAQTHVDAMLEKRVDGIIASGKRIDRHLPVDLSNLGIPVIYAFTEPDPESIGFVSDDEAGARLAVEHLARLGRRRIAHVTGPSSFRVVHQRAKAYRDVLREAGLEEPEQGVLTGQWTEGWGHEAAGYLFDGIGRPPDAVFCGNDQIARGVVDALRERGRRVPDDVAVIGFDNWEIVAAATRPPLTTVDMNLKDLGREAGLTLLKLVDREPIEPGIRKLPCRLVVRDSCGTPPGG